MIPSAVASRALHKVVLIAPPPEANISGGNLYNLGLTVALRDAGVEVRIVDAASAKGSAPLFLVDSLHLPELPRLQEMLDGPVHLLAHYLPSLVSGGPREVAALGRADGFVVPSAYMAGVLGSAKPIAVVAPARISRARAAPSPGPRLRAIVVANLVAGKGVLPFLQAVDFGAVEVTVVGSHDADPAYAAECRRHGARFAGALSHTATLDAVAAADVFVSASRMESYGLALAEARGLGVPIIARRGGNAATHVDEAAGGVLVDSDEALAAECARVAANRAELSRRSDAAQAGRPPSRSWAEAARDFLAAFHDHSSE